MEMAIFGTICMIGAILISKAFDKLINWIDKQIKQD